MVRDPRGSTHARVRHRPAPPVSSTPRLRPSSRRLTAPLFRLRSTQNQILDAAAIDSSVHGKSPGRQVKGARPNPKPVAELYHFGQTIGRGGFAEVRRATHKVHGTDYAMKIIKLPKTGQRALKEEIFYEIGLLANMDSPYIVKLHEFFVESDRIIMVTELLEGGDLFDAVVACGHYDEHMAKRIFRRILLGVRYLHEVGVTHCDLKLENLLLASETDLDSVKICDLGLAKKASARSRFLPSGTPEYISPEVLEANMAGADQGAGQSGENGSKSVPQAHGPSVDNWACGVLLFVLLAGYTPFAHEDEHAMYELIRTGNFNFTQSPVWENVSRDAKDLIEKFLTVDESQRMTAERALATHPWLVERAPNAVTATNGSGWEATPMTPRVHLESVQKNLKNERDTGKLFKGAVNAVIAMNRVAQGVSGKCPNTYARRKSVGSQQRAPVLAGQPSQSPEKVRAIARIPSEVKMDELAEVDSDDERDWSVRGGVRRGRSQTPSLSRSSSRARLSRSSSRDLSLSRHASREPYPARSAGKSPYSGNRSNRGTGTASGDASPVRQSPRVSNEWTDDDARSDGGSDGSRSETGDGGGTPSPPRSVGKVRSEGSVLAVVSTPTPSPRRSVGKVQSEGSVLAVVSTPTPSPRRSIGKVQSEGSGLAAMDPTRMNPGRRSPTPGMALQDLSPGSPRGRAGQSPLSRSPRSASPALDGDGSRRAGGLATVSDSALMRDVTAGLVQGGAVRFGSATSWAGSDGEGAAQSPANSPPARELTPRSRLAKTSEGSIA